MFSFTECDKQRAVFVCVCSKCEFVFFLRWRWKIILLEVAPCECVGIYYYYVYSNNTACAFIYVPLVLNIYNRTRVQHFWCINLRINCSTNTDRSHMFQLFGYTLRTPKQQYIIRIIFHIQNIWYVRLWCKYIKKKNYQ